MTSPFTLMVVHTNTNEQHEYEKQFPCMNYINNRNNNLNNSLPIMKIKPGALPAQVPEFEL